MEENMNKLILGTFKGAEHPVYIYVNKEGFFDLGCNGREYDNDGYPVNALNQDTFENGIIKDLTDCDLDVIDDLICEAGILTDKITDCLKDQPFEVTEVQLAMQKAACKAVVKTAWQEIRKVADNPGASCLDCNRKECPWYKKGGKHGTAKKS